METKRYMPHPLGVEAIRIDDNNANDVYSWIRTHSAGAFDPDIAYELGRAFTSGVSIEPEDGMMLVGTPTGLVKVLLGDWIIRGVAGEFHVCRPDIFAATYKQH